MDERGSSTDAVRHRLLMGLAESIQQRGYAQTRIEDVVRGARTSKRTFYEHFHDLPECFLELYRANTDGLIGDIDVAVRAAVRSSASGSDVIRAAIRAYFQAVTAEPALSAAHLREIYQLGARGMDARRQVHERHAAALLRGLPRRRGLPALTLTRVAMVVGALNELVLRCLEQGQLDSLEDLLDEATCFVAGALSL
jgi:AcrR family transcriptional regulator